MSATLDLLAIIMKKHKLTTHYAASKFMGIPRETVYVWVRGRGAADDPTAMKLCEFAGEDPAVWVPLIHAERAKTPAVKKLWKQIADKAARAAVAALVAVVFTLSPAPSEAKTQAKSNNSEVCILC